MSKFTRLLSIALLLVVVLSACNLPSTPVETEGADSVLTAAAQTVEANLTQAAILNPPTVPVIPTSTTAPPTSTLAVSTNTQSGATNTPICDQAQFIKDVTIPDGTEFDPNETFTKKWQVKNVGTCTWSGYSLVFDTGDAMGGPASKPIGSVAPGQEVVLEVDLVAPSSADSYRGYWRIKNSAGVLIPVLNGYQSTSFFVDIKVSGPDSFAVTGVSYTTTTWDDASHTDCPKVIADITVNTAGTVIYKWTRSDGANISTQSLVFGSAGTQSVEYEWALGSGAPSGTYWVGIYIDDPNHQDFGHVNVTKCTVP
jgi:hypothetical protein